MPAQHPHVTDPWDPFPDLGAFYGMSAGEVIQARGQFFDYLKARLKAPFRHTTPVCEKPMDCGSTCYLPPTHKGPCLCMGDYDGQPDTCPA
jgi:hypothetical protein